MRAFARLFHALEVAPDSAERVLSVVTYLRAASELDAAWAVHLLRGEKLKRVIGPQGIRLLLSESVELPGWLVESSLVHTNDLAEAAALLISPVSALESFSLSNILRELLETSSLEEKTRLVLRYWKVLSRDEAYVFNRIVLGTFKAPITRLELAEAIAIWSGISPGTAAFRLTARYDSIELMLRALRSSGDVENISPFPFALAMEANAELVTQLRREEYEVERLLRGLRAQLVKRGDHIALWLKTGEIISDLFPVLIASAEAIPGDAVLDGKILLHERGELAPQTAYERRLAAPPSRQTLQKYPATYVAFDLLELNGQDMRDVPFTLRREQLESLLATLPSGTRITSSELLDPRVPLEELQAGSGHGDHGGLILKHRESTYASDNAANAWLTWRRTPHTIEAVLMHAERGDAGSFAYFTFGVWNGEALVPVAKLQLDMEPGELAEIENWIAKHTLDKFGPVRTLPPVLVFRLEFESVERSTRRKSGLMLHRARIVERLHEYPPRAATTLDSLLHLLHRNGA